MLHALLTRNTGPGRLRAWTAPLSWQRAALVTILALSAGLELFRLDREGWSNLYYAATVKSMLTNWHNFFFASYDPGGFVTVDKPPLGFWLQAASAALFGFRGVSLLLPQALAAVASVALLHDLVRRSFGAMAGLVAALALALTPISVATARNNTIDSLLVLVVLGAAWAGSRAVEPGRPHLRWLLLSMLLVGAGFNIKMLQAYLPLPAFYTLYLLAAPVRWWQRLAHLGVATVVLAVVSFSWAAAVDLTPPDRRPYVGSSADNTVRQLILGHNGLDRLLHGRRLFGGRSQPAATPAGAPPPPAGAPITTPPAGNPGGASPGGSLPTAPEVPPAGGAADGGAVRIGGLGPGPEGDRPGVLRLLSPRLAGQVSWLLPLAVLSLIVLAWQTRACWRPRADRSGEDALRWRGLLLWGGWLLATGGFFSYANMFHPYYLVMLAPAIAALVGAGVVALWQEYRRGSWRAWLLPAALTGSAGVQWVLLSKFPEWSRRLTPLVAGVPLAAAAGLVVARLWSPWQVHRLGVAAATAGVLALLVAPAVWSGYTAWDGPGAPLPMAGPMRGGHGAVSGLVLGTPSVAAYPLSQRPARGLRPPDDPSRADRRLLDFLLAHQGEARFLVAVPGAGHASGIILATGKPVMALGGFNGSDPILTTERLARLVERGTVRFFLVPRPGPPPGATSLDAGAASSVQPAPAIIGMGPPEQNDLMRWVRERCAPVPPELWQSPPPSVAGDVMGPLGSELYDCDGAGTGGPPGETGRSGGG